MDKYIKNLLPRLKQYGQKLNKIESFVDKTWVLYNATNSFQTFRFLRSGKLLVTVSGLVEEHKWEYLPPDSLYIKKSEKKGIMYRQAFFLDSLFIMEVEGANFERAMFYNEAEIPDGDVVQYLKKIMKDRLGLRSIGSSEQYFYSNLDLAGMAVGKEIFDNNLEPLGNKN